LQWTPGNQACSRFPAQPGERDQKIGLETLAAFVDCKRVIGVMDVQVQPANAYRSVRRFASKTVALASVNSTAKAVSAALEPLAASQKVFELTLVQQMKAASIITQLEAARQPIWDEGRIPAASWRPTCIERRRSGTPRT
jgi:hypothetical protein